jgi:hypothetical protein
MAGDLRPQWGLRGGPVAAENAPDRVARIFAAPEFPFILRCIAIHAKAMRAEPLRGRGTG